MSEQLNDNNSSLKLRFFIILAILLFSLYHVAPTAKWLYYLNTGKDTNPEYAEIFEEIKAAAIPRGLDLEGGVHLALMVDVEETLDTRISQVESSLKVALDGMEGDLTVQKYMKDKLKIAYENSEAGAKVAEALKDDFKGYFSNLKDVDFSQREVTLNFDTNFLKMVYSRAIDQSVLVIRNRIDTLGLTQPSVSKSGSNRIIVQLPGVKDPELAKKTIMDVARLEFRLVADPEIQAMVSPTGQIIEGQELPSEYVVLPFSEKDMAGKEKLSYLVVEKKTELDGQRLDNAYDSRDPNGYNSYYVGLKFDLQGARIFKRITGDNVGRRLAIVLDGKVFSAPNINSEIGGGNAQITGGFNAQDAQHLSNVLKAGALPVPLRVAEDRTVGPTLGRDFVSKGLKATLFGFIAVIIFMIIYYGFAGLVADAALLFNLVIIIGVMSLMRATMTLPGIAGLILTVGMAVDANVIIYERIKEELRKGKSIRSAVSDGYSRAFLTIFDSNFTTIFAAIVLLEFGKGPIKGFAVTLSLGIIASMFTALFCTRFVFESILEMTETHSLNFGIGHLFEKTKIPFMHMRKGAFTISTILLILSAVFFFLPSHGINWGIDFSGGTSLQVSFDGDVSSESLRTVLTDAGFKSPLVQEMKEDAVSKTGSEYYIKVKANDNSSSNIREDIVNVFKNQLKVSYKIQKVDSVGSEVGKDFRGIAMMCLFFSSLVIVGYLWYRFEFKFGVAAVIALVHDLTITMGILTLLGKDITLTTVAALLTIMGYSVNDTIVIFDRIRENLGMKGSKGFAVTIDKSINDSMSRTVITSLTTLLVVLVMYLFGGPGIHDDFALPLLIGIIVGTYSSSFVAAPVVYVWENIKKSVEGE